MFGLFEMINNFIESLPFPDWVSDALADSLYTLPLLFLAFVIIELAEFYFADKINNFMLKTKKSGPVVGSLGALLPQCGFSVIASSLYSGRFVSRGTLIAIYIATSDEALPVLFANTESYIYILPLIVSKLIIAISAGYLIDIIFKSEIISGKEDLHVHELIEDVEDEGCCKHDIVSDNKVNLWLHPLAHTFNVFFFILIITLFLNFFISGELLTNIFSNAHFKFFEPVLTSLIGLIPNCAVSVALVMMLVKGTISFGAAVSGLSANAGLGLLVLLKKNKSFTDSMFLIMLLFIVSALSGFLLQFIVK